MDKYVKLAKIGQGSFGSAFVVTKKADPSGKKYVIKEIRVDPRDQQSALREAKLLSALDHPNIIACKESFLLPPLASAAVGGLPGRGAVRREQVLCIVTEFADGGDLRKSMQQRQGKTPRFFQEHEVLDLFVQVCLALKHLHDRKIIHRDIKPENIFLSGTNVVKLGDFGVATVLSHTLASAETLTGTPYYTSPEICLGKRYNSKTDVWSLGCVLYELATFAHPFDGRSQRQLFDNIIRASYTSVSIALAGRQTQYSTGLGSLVAAMLMKNPRDRPSVGSLLKTPLVMARIQRFLSERAIADELNHTVLHGHDIFRKNAVPSHVQASAPAAVVKAKAPVLSPPPAPIAAARRAVEAPVRASSAPKKDNNPKKALPSPAVRARLKNAGLRRSRSFKKRATPVGSNWAASPFRSPIVAKKAVPRPNAIRAKAQAVVAASLQQIKAVAGSRDPPKRSMHGGKDASDLPEPPPASAVMAKPPRGAVANRVVQFNAQAQRQELMDHIAAPPPPPLIVKQPLKAGKAYPKPVVIQVQGHSAGSSAKLQPQAASKKKVAATRDGIRQHIRAKKKELALAPTASPLDDPVILVQNLPDLCESAASESLPSLHDEQRPVMETAVEACNAAVETDSESNEHAADEAQDTEVLAVHPWPAPIAENLEFERMVLQLRSVIEAANDTDDTDGGQSDEEDASGEDGANSGSVPVGPSFSIPDNSPPPPYSSEAPTLDVAVLEQDAFKRALHSLVAHPDDAARSAEALAGLPHAHHQPLLWMRDYMASVTGLEPIEH